MTEQEKLQAIAATHDKMIDLLEEIAALMPEVSGQGSVYAPICDAKFYLTKAQSYALQAHEAQKMHVQASEASAKEEQPQEQPKFENSCMSCIFLGTWKRSESPAYGHMYQRYYDLYYCAKHKQLVAVKGPGKWDKSVMDVTDDEQHLPLQKAKRLYLARQDSK